MYNVGLKKCKQLHVPYIFINIFLLLIMITQQPLKKTHVRVEEICFASPNYKCGKK